MARLDSSLGAPGAGSTLVRRADGTDPGSALFNTAPYTGAVYPDSSSNVDIVKPNFGISNTFYLRFERNGNISQFQIMYRYRKRYTPSAAAALDSSGSDVWTDWSEWATEKGTQADPGEEVATVKFGSALTGTGAMSTTWQKALAHTYSEGDTYDCVAYQFRVRVYNAVQNTCGAWTVFSLNVRWVPAITGLTVTKRSDGGFNVAVQTNAQRNVRANVYSAQYYDAADGGRYRSIWGVGTVVNKQALPDGMAFTIPAAAVKNNKAYFERSWIGLAESYDTTARFLSCQVPSWNNPPCVFIPQTHTEPTLPAPVITTDTDGQSLQVCVKSSGENYTDVQGSAQWTDLRGVQRTEELAFTWDSTAGKWTANEWLPPLDVEMKLHIAVVGDDWALHTKTVTIPSDGLICFDRTLTQDRSQTVRLKYNQSVSTGDEVAGETVECVGRDFPISRYGGPLSRTIKIDASYLNPARQNVGGDGWKNSIECLTQPNDWVLRIPGGEVYRVMVSSLDRNTDSPTNTKVLDVSLTCKVVGYDVA